MDTATLEALQGSIGKWEKIVDGTGVDDSNRNCPLCHLFINDRENDCEGCPVYEETGKIYCHNTPYIDFEGKSVYDGMRRIGRKVVTEEDKETAQKEVDFLKSLLPAVIGD